MTVEFTSTPIAPLPALDLRALAQRRGITPSPGLRDACVAFDAAERQRERLFEAGTLCVTTGQQPGVLTGPLFSIYKALSAVAFARRFERALGRAVVPVYWVAGDDHDHAEAGHVHVFTVANEIEQLALPERPHDAPLTPLYREPLGAAIDGLLDAVVAGTPPTEFRDDILGWLRRHYRPTADFATAFAGALAELLGPHGLVVLQSTHPAVKRAMQPCLVRALEGAGELDGALRARADALGKQGAHPPVAVGDGATLVMVECGLGRDRLVLENGTFHARRSHEEFTLGALRRLSEESPERLSPNVLLRPVVEAALLPTVAYIAGPGELAYLPQTEPVYRHLEVAPQQPLARWSAHVMEGRVRKVLDKYGITPDELALPEGQLERRLVGDDMPEAAGAAMRALRETLQTEYGNLRSAAIAIDPTLKKPVESAQRAAMAGVRDIEKRLVSHLKQNNDVLLQQVAKARNNLMPTGKPQERVFTIAPYLIRYGRAFLDDALAAAEAWAATLEPDTRTP